MNATHALPCLLFFALSLASPAAEQASPAPVAGMIEATQKGLPFFLEEVHAHGWNPPIIPSQWYLDRVAGANQQANGQAARALGRNLAVRMAELAPTLQQIAPDDQLLHRAEQLCDLADWCDNTAGYGNALLNWRALDLASVAEARLAANPDFPLAEVSRVIGRTLRSARLDPATRIRILNQEAGAEFFGAADQDEINRLWDSGRRLLAESRNPELAASRRANPGRFQISDTPILRAHLEFFADDPPTRGIASTVLNRWEHKEHARIAFGLTPRHLDEAWALAEFRRVVGEFPRESANPGSRSTPPRSTRRVGRQGPILVDPNPARSPGEEAFLQAWRSALAGNAHPDETPRVRLVPQTAWTAYEAVRRGEFLDNDSREEKSGVRP